MANILTIVGVLAYALVLVLIGLKGRSKESSSESFLMGGRSMGPIVSLATMTMGILSGMAFFGTPALVLRQGNLTMIVAGFGLTSFAGAWFGYKLWKYGKVFGFRTASQYLAARYESPAYGKLAALIHVIFMIPYMTVQFVAVGNGLSYFTTIPFELVVFLFAAIMIANMLIGGAGGVNKMDVFNVILGIALPLILCILAIRDGGGMERMAEMAMENDPTFLQIGAGSTFGDVGFRVFVQFLTGIFAVMFAPHLMNKMMMAKDRNSIRKTIWTGPLFYIIVCTPVIYLMAWIGIALYKPQLMESGMSDFMVQTIMSNHGNLVINILMLCSLLAFAMSTANAFGMSCANIIASDFAEPYYRKRGVDGSELDRKVLRISKLSIVVIVLACAIMSLTVSMFINDYAYALSTPGFAQLIPAVLGGLFWKRPSKQAAVSATGAGLVVLVITTYIVPQPMGIHQVIWSLGINLIVYLIVTFATKPSKETIETFFPQKSTQTASN